MIQFVQVVEIVVAISVLFGIMLQEFSGDFLSSSDRDESTSKGESGRGLIDCTTYPGLSTLAYPVLYATLYSVVLPAVGILVIGLTTSTVSDIPFPVPNWIQQLGTIEVAIISGFALGKYLYMPLSSFWRRVIVFDDALTYKENDNSFGKKIVFSIVVCLASALLTVVLSSLSIGLYAFWALSFFFVMSVAGAISTLSLLYSYLTRNN